MFVSGAFDDEDIIHVEGNVDPVRDIEIIHEELRLKDEEMIGPVIDKLEKTAVRGGDKKLKPEYVSKIYSSGMQHFPAHICVTKEKKYHSLCMRFCLQHASSCLRTSC